jgi:hypothetical protein
VLIERLEQLTNCTLIVVIKRVGNFNHRQLIPGKVWLLRILRADRENAGSVPAAPPNETPADNKEVDVKS